MQVVTASASTGAMTRMRNFAERSLINPLLIRSASRDNLPVSFRHRTTQSQVDSIRFIWLTFPGNYGQVRNLARRLMLGHPVATEVSSKRVTSQLKQRRLPGQSKA